MEIKIVHHTVDLMGNGERNQVNEQALLLGGREAGICYMADNYFSTKINDDSAAERRANTIINSGHHSPFDHYTIGLEISGIPKVLAMILNSVHVYTTSEKSARYTVMKPDTEVEARVYDKWQNIFAEVIHDKYPEIDEKTVDKLALENARYMISVFTPTSMGYTTSFRQLNYMGKWFDDLANRLANSDDAFDKKLEPYCREMADKLKAFTDMKIPDNKNRKLDFLRLQSGESVWDGQEHIGDTYSITYNASFAQLAQAQRHRTLHYEMEFNASRGYTCYIPEILRDRKELVDMWVSDFNRIKDCFPQCTLVRVIEQGRTTDFALKCKERLCGRAQLEVAKQTTETLDKMLGHLDKMSSSTRNELLKCTFNNKPCAKCMMQGIKCTEQCFWGAKYALDRLI